jgi:hypothetical protein
MPLRLTLRTLLSYLDDTLEPNQAKAIGQKVAESEQARELMERIKQVTRRRRLTTPPATGPGGIDANTIAEYLDNEVSSEQAAEVEQICLASDVHLAEVAACHQILTLVLGEPALVPPSAKQRMYGLVKGPEAIPFRKPPKTGTKADLDLSTSHADHAGDESAAGFATAFKNPGSRNTLLLAGGGIIAACLLVVALWQLFRPAPNVNDVGQPNADQVAATDSGQKDKDAEKKAIADAAKDAAAKKEKEEKDTVVKKDEGVKPKAVANKDKGGNSAIQVIDVKHEPVKEIAFNPPNLKPAVLGQYEPNLKVPQILLQRGLGDKAGWERIWGKNLDVASARPLLSLPAMKNEVELKNGVHLTLWGTAPEIWPNYLVYESMVELYVNDALDVDMTLKRGRIVLVNTQSPSKPVVVRVRFEDPTQQKQAYFDIRLDYEKTVVAIERLCGFPQNEPFFEDAKHANRQGPYAEVLCFFLAGGGNIRSSNVFFTVDAATQPQWIRWNSSKGLESPQPFTMPDWILPTPKLGDAKDRARTLEAAAMLARNLEGKKQGKKLDVALQEAMDIEVDPASRVEALRCYVAMDDFSVALEMLDQDNPKERLRRSAVESLRYWMAQERDNEYMLFDKLKASSSNVVARKVMELLHGISAADAGQPATWQRLIENLDNPEVSLRELSAWNLELLVPWGRKIDYPPSAPFGIASAPQVDRRHAQAEWRKLIPPGNLPKTPKKK